MRRARRFSNSYLFLLLSTGCVLISAILANGKHLAPVAAESIFRRGYAAFEQGDYPKATRLWLKAATDGDANAMAGVGYLYSKGWGVPLNYRKAADWYEKAAAGSLNAMYDLGICYEQGRGRKRNYALAMKWYRRAAGMNFAPAMYAVGRLYSLGHGVHRNLAKALAWFKKAAAAGNDTAMSELAMVYRFGIGVARDRQKAQIWGKRAMLASERAAIGPALRGAFAGESHTWVIHNGFDGKPCDIELKAMRMHSRLVSLSLDVMSGKNDVGLSEFSGLIGRGMAPWIVVLAQSHGASHRAPTVLVNKHWRIGGGPKAHSFQYGSEWYRYDKTKDIWIPVQKGAPGLK